MPFLETGVDINVKDTLEIQESVVKAVRERTELMPVQKLEGEKLKELNAYSVADAVRYFSGVQIKDYGGIGGLKTINVRSLGSHHVGVFYDGIEVSNAQNGVVDLGRFSLDNMEAVTLYNGQRSGILQTAKDFSSASAVYLQTRRPVFKEGRKCNFAAGVKGGSFKTINPSFLWEQRLSRRVSLSFSTEFLWTSGEYRFRYSKSDGYDTTAVRKNGDVRMFRAEAAVFGDIDDGAWSAKLYFYDSERGYPGAVVREEPGKFRHQDRQWDDNFFVQGAFRKAFAPWYSLQVKGKYSFDYLHYLSDPRLDVSTMYVDNTYIQHEAYGSLAHLFTVFPWWTISLADDVQWNYVSSDMRDFAFPSRLQVLTSLSTAFTLDWMNVQAGLLHTYVQDKNAFSPSLVADFKPIKTQDFHIRGFYKSVFRMPTLNDLYYTFIGNIFLKPEKSQQFDLGVTYNYNAGLKWLDRVEFQIDGYFNQIKDKIIAMPTSNQFRWTMLNLGYVEILGTDLSFQMDMKAGQVKISPRLTYTFQRARDLTDSSSPWYGGQIPYIPWHSGSVILNIGWKGLGLNYSFIYTGERYESTANIPENYAQPWYTSDISLFKSFAFRKFSMRFTLDINNLFNQQYEVVQCYPMPGTNCSLKVDFKF